MPDQALTFSTETFQSVNELMTRKESSSVDHIDSLIALIRRIISKNI